MDLLRALAAGHSYAAIATARGRAVRTVSNRLHTVYLKLGVHNAAQAVAEAYRLGLLAPHTSTVSGGVS